MNGLLGGEVDSLSSGPGGSFSHFFGVKLCVESLEEERGERKRENVRQTSIESEGI